MKDRYNELTIKLPSEYIDPIADFIASFSDDGIEFGDDRLIIRSENDLTYIKDALVELHSQMPESFDISFNLESKENIDWIQKYKDSIEPIEAGKFYIFPSWYEPKDGLINIKIDPALAFGSGHHATTFSCLNAISQYVKEDDSIIDVGCGSGILALACKKLGANVDLCDTDPLSVESAKENFELNGESFDDIWEGSIDKTDKKYDIVIANIIADVLKFISNYLKNATNDGGNLILAGILQKKSTRLLASFDDMSLIERIQKDEWITLIYKKTTQG
jgi:ribosomal protein L11 methyltransferase